VNDYQGPPSTSLRNDEPARPFGTTHRTLPPGLAAVVSDGSASPGVDGPRMDCCLSKPGLLMAILRCSARQVGIDVYHACVLTLVASTPAHRLLPQPDSDLAETIAAAALAVLQRRRQGSAAATPAPQQGTRGPPTTATPIRVFAAPKQGGAFVPTSSGARAPRQGEHQ